MVEGICGIQFAKCEIESVKGSMQIGVCRDDGREVQRLNHLKAIWIREVSEFEFLNGIDIMQLITGFYRHCNS